MKEFRIPTGSDTLPEGIALGPDGTMWFTEANAGKIARITSAGAITNVANLGHDASPRNITAGPDGAMWITEGRGVARVTASGNVKLFSTMPHAPDSIAQGPDGALWFTTRSGPGVGRITTDGVITWFKIPRDPRLGLAQLTGIAVGPDHALWFLENAVGRAQTARIGRITTAGAIKEFKSGIGHPWQIAEGPDRAMWFTAPGHIGRITMSGRITSFRTPDQRSHHGGIVAGPDGAMWFDYARCSIARITMTGKISVLGTPTCPGSPYSWPFSFAAGPHRTLWTTEATGNRILRLSF